MKSLVVNEALSMAIKSFIYTINPLLPSVPYMARLAKILISVLEGFINEIFFESRDYESVDEKSLSWLCPKKKTMKKEFWQ